MRRSKTLSARNPTSAQLSFWRGISCRPFDRPWPNALVVQALKTLGQAHVDDTVVAALSKVMDSRERARALKEARYATSWVYEIIKRLAAEEAPPHA